MNKLVVNPIINANNIAKVRKKNNMVKRLSLQKFRHNKNSKSLNPNRTYGRFFNLSHFVSFFYSISDLQSSLLHIPLQRNN